MQFFFILLALLIFSGSPALAASPFNAGFKTIGSWSEESEFRLDLNVWYPTTRAANELNFSPWNINAALNAKCANGKFPVLLLSHPTTGTRFSYHELAAFFASRGFIVIAPTHMFDSLNNMDDLFTWKQMTRRKQELEVAINEVSLQKDISDKMDMHRVGIIGFGAGATVALLMGGALPDCAPWTEYCKKAGPSDPYCSVWAKERINDICSNLPLHESMADKKIKAIAAIAPAFGMIFGVDSFKYFYAPALLVATGADQFNLARLHCESIARFMGKKAHYLDLPDADTGSLMSACPPVLEAEIPELCLSVTPQKREDLQKTLSETLLTFFSQFLLNEANLPQIPDPPELAPREPEQSKESVKKSSSKK